MEADKEKKMKILWCLQPANLRRSVVHDNPFAWATVATIQQHNLLTDSNVHTRI